MADQFSVNLDGLDKLIKTLEKRFGPRPVRKALTRSLVEEAEDLIGAAKLVVPVDTGNLRDTGIVLPPKLNGGIECGFGGTAKGSGAEVGYALTVHETHKTKSKYLERPFNQMLKGFEDRVARSLKRSLGI